MTPVMLLEDVHATLLSYKIAPSSRVVAIAGDDYGSVTAWPVSRGYLVVIKHRGKSTIMVSSMTKYLRSYLIESSFSPLDSILQTANVIGQHAVAQASKKDDPPFYVMVTRFFDQGENDQGDPPIVQKSSFLECESGSPRSFTTFDEALVCASDALVSVELSENEIQTPVYKVVSVPTMSPL